MKYRSVKELSVHPLNVKIYGDTYDEELLESIKRKGVLTPLIITSDNKIMSGHRRFDAVKALKLETVPVVVSPLKNEMEIEEALIMANKQRAKTNEQIAKEFEHLKKIETERAKKRKAATQFNGQGKSQAPVVENFPPPDVGKARDFAAKQLGVSGKTAEKAGKVMEVIEQMKAAGKKEDAKKLRDTLNRSVDAAYKDTKQVRAEMKAWEKAIKILSDLNNDLRETIEFPPSVFDKALVRGVNAAYEELGIYVGYLLDHINGKEQAR